MVNSFVLITCDIGKEEIVMEQLEQLNDVKEILRVHGAYDLIAKVEGKSVDEVKKILENKIRTMRQIRSAMSLPLKLCN